MSESGFPDALKSFRDGRLSGEELPWDLERRLETGESEAGELLEILEDEHTELARVSTRMRVALAGALLALLCASYFLFRACVNAQPLPPERHQSSPSDTPIRD